MVTLDDAARMALALPEVIEGERRGNRIWSIRGKTFAWERPLTKADIKRFGDVTLPEVPILAVRVADLGEKEAILAAGSPGFFTMEHFDGFPAVLIELKKAGKKAVREAVVDAWLACAPSELAKHHLAGS